MKVWITMGNSCIDVSCYDHFYWELTEDRYVLRGAHRHRDGGSDEYLGDSSNVDEIEEFFEKLESLKDDDC